MAAVETAISRESSAPAAQTGHVGISTLPTGDALTPRMRDRGIAPSNIASSAIPIAAQRLYSNCRALIEVSGKTMRDGPWIGYRPVSRSACSHRRMPVTEALQRNILNAGLALEIAAPAQEVIAVTNK